jgi:hypothetical protein
MQWWNKHAVKKGVNRNGGWKGERWKNKYANEVRRAENEIRDNYQFIL